MRWLVAVLACTGCRQLLDIEGGVVATTDASVPDVITPVAHDEDGDTVDDSIDNCPAFDNKLQQPSADGLGTACDPRPMLPDRLATFVSFFPSLDPVDLEGSGELGTDFMKLTGGEIRLAQQITATRVAVVIDKAVFAIGGSIELRSGSNRCVVGPCSGSGTRCMQAIADNSTTELDVPTMPDVRFMFILDQLATALVCSVGIAGPDLSTMTAALPDPDRARIRVQGVTLELHSFSAYVAN